MLLADSLSRSGATLFRWRGVALAVLLPLLLLALHRGEPIEEWLGAAGDIGVEVLSFAMVGLGLAIRVWTAGTAPAGTSGRNRRAQVAATLNTTGPYALTRNPLYLGNCLVYLGVILLAQDAMLVLVAALGLWLYYERIIAAEEAFLADRFGDRYRTWAAGIPAFWPRLVRPRAAALPFSWRSALRREHTTAFFAALGVVLVDFVQDAFQGEFEPWALIFIAAACLAQAAIATLRRRTALLDVPGR